MEGESCSRRLQSLLEAIKSSDVVETRVQLLAELGELEFPEKSNLTSLLECLTVLWEDFTCLDASQCMLNNTILNVASKHIDSDISGCVVPFLALGMKASQWCGKHLKMTLMSTEESQEGEHCNLFFQLLLDFLIFSAKVIVSLSSRPVLPDTASMSSVGRFILEQLNLIKELVSEIKRINLIVSGVLEVTQTVIEAVMKLCKGYFLAVNWGCCDPWPEEDESGMDHEEAHIKNHVITITKTAIEKLCELGVLAANDGGSLVTILNLSWKGVVTILRLGRGPISKVVCVQDIIVSLLLLVSESLKFAAESWSSTLKEAISVTEARRTFLPVKFYLINVVKISSLYPCQSYLVYRDITNCLLMISTFKIILSYEKLLKSVSEVLSELLEMTSVDLLNSLLNSSEVKKELKFQFLERMFSDECSSIHVLEGSSGYNCTRSKVEIFPVSCEAMQGVRQLLLGRVALFHVLLSNSIGFEEDVQIIITRKLGWLLNILVDEEIYSSILDLQIPVAYVSGGTIELVWQPMFFALLHGLKTFMIAVSSSSAWVELQEFLVENLFHPHFLCWEIIMELWCFWARNSEMEVINSIIHQLCSLMKLLASPESFLIPGSPLRKMAQIICLLLNNCTTSVVEHTYNSLIADEKSQLSSVISGTLLLEGFPLNSLSENIKSVAKQKMIMDYFSFIGSFDGSLWTACTPAVGIPVFAISASLQSQQISISDVDIKTLKFLVAIIHKFRKSVDEQLRDHYHKLISETLAIISNVRNLYESDEMEEVILELKNLFISGSAASDTQLCLCKPYLALFMGGLGDMKMSENNDCAKSSAVWELYHMLFRERHWALVHLAIATFGYFAARTSCNQLWRFVPHDAALSYDLISGNEASEERFMSELKAFLEKEMALTSITPSSEQLELLVKEGMLLKKMIQKIESVNVETLDSESMEIDVENQSNKRRKLPDGIGKGMELLQSGLKVIGDGLSQWQQNNLESSELHEKLLAHFSRLEDAVGHLAILGGKV
uniref:Uncharacterized protein n=1 Tax=Rhizophora mucronata TaxID=61149 RepID=A0A2P2Q2M3_RHIMU